MAALLVMCLAAGAHYRSVIAERDHLRAEVALAEANRAALEQALSDERAAVEQTARSRDAARKALEGFKAGRQDDPEALEWGSQAVPDGEALRLCEALPAMTGCPHG